MGFMLCTSPAHIKVSNKAGALDSSSAAPARIGAHRDCSFPHDLLTKIQKKPPLSQFPAVRQTRTLRDSLRIIQDRTQPVRTCDVFFGCYQRGYPFGCWSCWCRPVGMLLSITGSTQQLLKTDRARDR